MRYGCGVRGSGLDGEGALIVSDLPGETTPRGYLMQHAVALLPTATDEQRQSQIFSVEAVPREGGVAVSFVCFAGENDDRNGGLIYCVLDQPNTQVVLGAESHDMEKAADVLQLIIGGVTIR